MEVKDPIALAARVAVVLGVGLVGVAGLLASIDLGDVATSLRATGVVVAVLGFVVEAVRARTPWLALAAVLPAALVALWLRAADNVDANVETGIVLSLGIPFLAVAARQLLSPAASPGASWFVGASGAALAALGGLTAALAQGMEPGAVWMLALGGALLVTYAVADRQVVTSFASSRSFVYGSGAWVLVSLMAGLCVGGYALARRNDHTFDLTRGQKFSLSEQARSVVAGLAEPVTITAWYGATNPARQSFQDLIGRFVEVNPDMLSVEFVDPLTEPLRAKQDLVSGDYGTVVLRAGDKTRRIEGDVVEEKVTRELVLLQTKGEHEVCWSMGHGEPDPDDDVDPVGFGGARSELESLNYKVRTVQVAREGVPASCEILVVARPTEEWFPYEREALMAYLAEGGSAFLLFDALELSDTPAELERVGVRVGGDVVIDLDLKSQLLGVDDPSLLVLNAADGPAHPITRSLGGAVILPVARSVRANREAAGVKLDEILFSGEQAWGETDPTGPDLQPDQGLEVIGRVPVMVAAEIEDPAALGVVAKAAAPVPEAPPVSVPEPEIGAAAPKVPDTTDRSRGVREGFAPKPGGKVVVIGDTDFATSQYLALGNNRDLFLNTIAWLVEEEAQIGERPQAAETLEISLAGEYVLCLVSLGLVPGIAIVMAIGTLVRRRYL